MPMTVIVTRNVPDRYRGFLGSVMLEVSPGVYLSPDMNRGVRERVWNVCREWSSLLPRDGAVTMLWRDPKAAGGLGLAVIGAPKADLRDHDGIWLGRLDLTEENRKLLGSTEEPPLSEK